MNNRLACARVHVVRSWGQTDHRRNNSNHAPHSEDAIGHWPPVAAASGQGLDPLLYCADVPFIHFDLRSRGVLDAVSGSAATHHGIVPRSSVGANIN